MSNFIGFRVTDEVYKKISSAAGRDRRTLSDYIRLAVLDKIDAEKKTNGNGRSHSVAEITHRG